MKINLRRLEELKRELHGDMALTLTQQEIERHHPIGLDIVMECVRQYTYNNHNDIMIKLLIDYDVLVNEETDENPIVKPHRFTENG